MSPKLTKNPWPLCSATLLLPNFGNKQQPELIEGFTTDDFILSIVFLEKTTRTRAKSYNSKTQNVFAFDLPRKEFIKEVLQTGLQRNFQTYSVCWQNIYLHSK